MLHRLPAFHSAGRLNAVIETPRGSRNKFSFEPDSGTFRLGKQLPAGAVFPFDFGFVPSTLADDGDPLDVLVLLETPTFPGCVVRARLVGVIDGQQTGRSGRTSSNPRLVAVATKSTEYAKIRRLSELPQALVDEITHFFVSYNEATGKTYRPTGTFGRRKAASMIEDGIRRRQNASARSQKRRRPMRRVA
ncbi:MAG: inorganic diphosphatase [Chloroflexota bacterium]